MKRRWHQHLPHVQLRVNQLVWEHGPRSLWVSEHCPEELGRGSGRNGPLCGQRQLSRSPAAGTPPVLHSHPTVHHTPSKYTSAQPEHFPEPSVSSRASQSLGERQPSSDSHQSVGEWSHYLSHHRHSQDDKYHLLSTICIPDSVLNPLQWTCFQGS